jgi:hypothetical protein
MADEANFLVRWSRRKRDAAPNAHNQPKPNTTACAAATSEPAAASSEPAENQPPFDRANLPTIESIDAKSNIHAFLAAGVPADLTRAALRRAWSSDPSIRGFVGLSENSWDFNAPDGVPGFGSVEPEDLRRLLAQVMEEPEAAEDGHPSAEVSSANQVMLRADTAGPLAEPAPQQPAAHGSARDRLNPNHGTCDHHQDPAHNSKENATMPQSPRRGHGGALPKT